MNCPDCGSEIKKSSQKFCEQCGAEIPLIAETAEKTASIPTTQAQQKPYSRPGGLFDINRTYYVLKEKYWDWGSGDIYDKNGKIIGKMSRVFINIRRKVELCELNGTVSASIHEKIISAIGAQDLKDPQGNLIARIKKKITSFFRPKFWLEDPNGKRWYEAQGEFMGWSFKIREIASGKIVAEIEKADRWKDVFLGGLLDFQDTYALKILDNETDRRILVGFVLSIDNVLHDNKHGITAGWRPFGRGRRGRGFPFPRRW